VPVRETMGQRLQRLRKAVGLSQSQLAKAAGVPVGTLRNWEQDIRSPLLNTAGRVARALGVSLDDLIEESGQERPQPARRAMPSTPLGADLEATEKKTKGRLRKGK
jgi:transcriptional regulator with XRE-family HTH domain